MEVKPPHSRQCNCGISFIMDSSGGFSYCPQCGLVGEDLQLEGDFTFTETDSGSFVRNGSVVGLHQKEPSAYHANSRYRFLPNLAKLESHLLQYTRNLALLLGAGRAYAVQAVALLKQFSADRLQTGDYGEKMAAACLYAALRMDRRPITLQDVARFSQIDVYAIGKSLTKLLQHTKLSLPPPDPADFLDRGMQALPSLLTQEKLDTQDLAHRLIAFADKMLICTGKNPLSITGAALLVALEAQHLSIAQFATDRANIIAAHLHLTGPAMRRRANEIKHALLDFMHKTMPWGAEINLVGVTRHVSAILDHFEWLQARAIQSSSEQTETRAVSGSECTTSSIRSPSTTSLLSSSSLTSSSTITLLSSSSTSSPSDTTSSSLSSIASSSNETSITDPTLSSPSSESLDGASHAEVLAPILKEEYETKKKAGITDYFDHIRPPLLQQQERRMAKRKEKIERTKRRLSTLLSNPGSVLEEEEIDLEEIRISQRLMEGDAEDDILFQVSPPEQLPEYISFSEELTNADLSPSELQEYLKTDLEVSLTSKLIQLGKKSKNESKRRKKQRRALPG